jgi:hypothetical protein
MNPTTGTVRAGLSPADWEDVHTQVQAVFDDLENRVRSRCPSVNVRSGKTSGRVWFLYTYRHFNLTTDDEAEDIVAGVSFTPSPTGDGICILADIGGGETGVTDFEIAERTVPAERGAVLAAARELVEELSRQDEVVAKALAERRPPPNYRAGLV